MRVEIWSDIACPWCYIGKARFEQGLAAFDHRDEVEVVHRSFELAPDSPRGETGPVLDMLASKYGVSREQAEAMEARVAEAAADAGLGWHSGRDNGNTFDLHRLLHLAKDRGCQGRLLDLLLTAHFAEERSVFDPATLAALAADAGLDPEEARAVLADESRYADAVRADEREAAELGANAVPFFVLDRRFGVSGGQPAEVFTQALTQAWESSQVSGMDKQR